MSKKVWIMYDSWHCFSFSDKPNPYLRHIEVDEKQFKRWEKAVKGFGEVQEEIRQLLDGLPDTQEIP